MSSTPGSTTETVAGFPRECSQELADVRETLVSLCVNSIDRIAEVQKSALDVAVQQNTEIMDIYKKSIQKLPAALRPPYLEVVNTMFERFSDAQKNVIDLAVEQSHSLIDAMKNRAATVDKATDKAAETAVNLGKEAVERTVATQKKVLETTVAKAKAAIEATREQVGLAGAPADAAIDSFKRGVDTVVEAHKEMLELVTK